MRSYLGDVMTIEERVFANGLQFAVQLNVLKIAAIFKCHIADR